MHLNGFFQNAYVTHNLEHAVALVRDRHGIKEWIYFESKRDVFTAQGGYGPCHVKVALGWVGELQIELIEPVSGNVQLYLDYLPADKADNAPRFHHIGMRVMDWDKARAAVDEKQWPVAREGGVEGCKLVYFDARESLGHYIEYVWMSPELWAATGGH